MDAVSSTKLLLRKSTWSATKSSGRYQFRRRQLLNTWQNTFITLEAHRTKQKIKSKVMPCDPVIRLCTDLPAGKFSLSGYVSPVCFGCLSGVCFGACFAPLLKLKDKNEASVSGYVSGVCYGVNVGVHFAKVELPSLT